MGSTRVISTTTIQAPNHNKNIDSTHKIHLTPWDLHFLPVQAIQKGLLFHSPNTNEQDIHTQIHHLKHSFSSTLAFFPLLSGRLVIQQHQHNNNSTCSCYILCNNAGALFVQAVAPNNTSVADILNSSYVPPFVHSFFPLNGVKNYEATSQPLLAVQVTELIDGIFIGCTINHVAADGKSFWHFINSWAEISRGNVKPSKLPAFSRFFPDGIHCPIRFPFTKEPKNYSETENEAFSSPLPERIFHFAKEKIVQLKAKANEEAGTDRISSLQALLTHLWREDVDPREDTYYVLIIGARPRMVPPLAEDYFGNAAVFGIVTMKAGELVREGGIGKAAFEMNKIISSSSDDKIKSHYESWVRTPKLISVGSLANGNHLVTSSSPRFDFYGNDFGWGKPVAVRSGAANKKNGKITVFEGEEKGSIDIEVSLPYEILEALGNDPDFMDAIP